MLSNGFQSRRRTGKSREKASEIESLFDIVKSMSVRKSGKLLYSTYKIRNTINKNVTRFEIIWQQWNNNGTTISASVASWEFGRGVDVDSPING